MSNLRSFFLLFLALTIATPFAAAQMYPDKPLRIILPFPPGGPSDTLMREIADKLSARWRQPVIIENKGGASGIVAAQAAAQAAPDGYTLFMVADPQMVANRFLFKKLPYDPQRDFKPVTTLVTFNAGIVVNTSRIQAKTLPELIALLKAYPGKFNYGSFGAGSSPHLSMELFKSLAGVDVVHIPYKGLAPLAVDFQAGRIDIAYISTNPLPMLNKDGRARVIAMDGTQRSPLLPDVPTFGEAGLKGMEAQVWFGIVVPAATPRAIIDRLNSDLVAVVRDPHISETSMRAKGYFPVGNTPEQFAKLIDDTAAVWGPVIKKANITLE